MSDPGHEAVLLHQASRVGSTRAAATSPRQPASGVAFTSNDRFSRPPYRPPGGGVSALEQEDVSCVDVSSPVLLLTQI